MKRLKDLGLYQKIILIILTAMVLIFTIVYIISASKPGYLYRNAILVPHNEDGRMIYSGKIYGEPAEFAVKEGKTVEFRLGDRSYGPYTLKEDDSAIHESLAGDEKASGIEIRRGEDIFFRGAVTGNGEHKFLYNEDGSPESLKVLITMEDGTLTDDRGNLIGPMEPTASDIIELAKGPELTHRGDWALWLEAVIFCIATALAILFADEIFRLGLRLQIKNADRAEPSDWEIAGRYVAWTLLPILAFIIFIVGLLL